MGGSGSGRFPRVACRLCAQARRGSDFARDSRDIRLRVRAADGFDEPETRASAGDGVYAAGRIVQLFEFEAGAGDCPAWWALERPRATGSGTAAASESFVEAFGRRVWRE